MRLTEIFRFEVEYRLRRASTWGFGLLLVAVPFLMMHAINAIGTGSYLNAPHSVAITSLIAALVGMLVTAALFGDAATRDVQVLMRPLLCSTPLRKVEYLGGRFLGALVVNALLLPGIPIGLLLGSLMPYMAEGKFGPLLVGGYVQAYLVFLLPNLLLTGAVLFTAAALSRQVLPAYLSAIGLFLGYVFAQGSRGDPDNRTLAALADPFGISVVEDLTRYWTQAELQTRLIGLPDVLLWNRLVWFTVALATLGVLAWRFRLADADRKRRRRAVAAPDGPQVRPRPTPPVLVPASRREFGLRARTRQTLAVARLALADIARSRAFLAILAAAVALMFMVAWNVGPEVFGTAIWPLTHLIATAARSGPVAVIVAVLIALCAGELVWRERDVRISGISDAAPVPDSVLLLGRFVAMALMLVALQAVFMGAGMALQAVQGYTRFEPVLYVRILFGLTLVDYLLFAALAMAVHVVVNHKALGHLIVLLLFLFSLVAAPMFGVQHRLLVYGSDPGWVYSDMNGFGPFVMPWIWFKLYWAAWALLLIVAARLSWIRGREVGLRQRLSAARDRLAGAAARAAAVAALLIVALGGFIFYNTNVLNEYRTPLEAAGRRAEYERRYKRYEEAPQPLIEAALLRVEIYPEQGAAEVRGSYHLVNRSGSPIDSVHVLLHPDVETHGLRFDRAATRVLLDPKLRYHIYVLRRALLPGDSLRLGFHTEFRPRGFPNHGVPTAVAANGAYFDRQWLPSIGYQPALEVHDPKTRRELGLPARTRLPGPDDAAARVRGSIVRDADLVHVEAVVGTDEEQTAVTTGTLQRTWVENGRRYFHYRTESPLLFGTPFFSARYDLLEDRWGRVALQIFHHPTHTFNLPRMMRGMKAALAYHAEHFGPYPYPVLRIVEFPRYASFARAHPHTIAFSEGSAFLTRVDEGDVDRPFFVVAHETAHQWWGDQLRAAPVRGAALLSETLAQYGAMMVMEHTLGTEQVRRFYDYEMDHYLRFRSGYDMREVPLLDVEDQSYLYYHKGAVAMYSLRENIGEAAVNTALRRLLERHKDAGPPYATSRDLYGELQAVTPDSLHPLLVDLFETITLWDVRAERAYAEPTGTGEWRVTLDVVAAKLRTDSLGNEAEFPMDDLVEIGVFAEGDNGGRGGDPLYLRRHRVRNGKSTITVTVPRRPALAGIDPIRKLIQRETGDNVVGVETPR
jgi:ABC-2 type transport system permease protein